MRLQHIIRQFFRLQIVFCAQGGGNSGGFAGQRGCGNHPEDFPRIPNCTDTAARRQNILQIPGD